MRRIRVKTELELIKEFGKDWRYTNTYPSWIFRMDHMFGKELYNYEITKFGNYSYYIELYGISVFFGEWMIIHIKPYYTKKNIKCNKINI